MRRGQPHARSVRLRRRSVEAYWSSRRRMGIVSGADGGACDSVKRQGVTPVRARVRGRHGDAGATLRGVAIEGGDRADGRIAFRFHARDVHLVMGPRSRGTPVPFRVFVHGQPPSAAHGLDVDEQGRGTLIQQRLYQLVREPRSITDRTLRSRSSRPARPTRSRSASAEARPNRHAGGRARRPNPSWD